MRQLILGVAIMALLPSTGFAVATKPEPQPTVVDQIKALREQVAVMQKQMDDLKHQPRKVCIAVWCA